MRRETLRSSFNGVDSRLTYVSICHWHRPLTSSEHQLNLNNVITNGDVSAYPTVNYLTNCAAPGGRTSDGNGAPPPLVI